MRTNLLCLLRGPALLLCLAAAPLSARGQDACFSSLVTGTVTDVTKHGDIELSTGQSLRPADITLPEANPWRQQAFAFLENLKGQPTTVDIGGKPDRWKRLQSALAMPDGDLAEMLVAKGLAVVDPGEATLLCNKDLLGTEQQARDRRSGLWSDSANRPIAAREREKLLERHGKFTLVIGRVVSVGVRSKWTYLNFGRNWKLDFSASIPATIWAKMSESGLTAETLRGKNVLIRGVIRKRDGPSMEISTPEILEIL